MELILNIFICKVIQAVKNSFLKVLFNLISKSDDLSNELELFKIWLDVLYLHDYRVLLTLIKVNGIDKDKGSKKLSHDWQLNFYKAIVLIWARFRDHIFKLLRHLSSSLSEASCQLELGIQNFLELSTDECKMLD